MREPIGCLPHAKWRPVAPSRPCVPANLPIVHHRGRVAIVSSVIEVNARRPMANRQGFYPCVDQPFAQLAVQSAIAHAFVEPIDPFDVDLPGRGIVSVERGAGGP